MTSKDYSNHSCPYCSNQVSNAKKIIKNNPGLTSGIVIGGALTTASLINPTLRKVTLPTFKFIAKQQLKILAGVGLFSIASFISSQDYLYEDEIMDEDIIFLD
ncbi:MAG: hypothetical protein ACRDA3_11845 [Peptostreptococcaceae bacterium]